MTEFMYHYTESGLDNVWLINGYHVEQIDSEECISFEHLDELHSAIGKTLAEKPTLTGAELRFLRKELGISQRMLGYLLGSSEQSVSFWEQGSNVPEAEGRLLKAYYMAKSGQDSNVAEHLERLVDSDKKDGKRLIFHDTDDGWKMAA